MRKKLIILSFILLGSLGLNLIAAEGSCSYTHSSACRQADHSLTATPQNDLQWDDLGLRHLLPASCKTFTSNRTVGRTHSCCGVSRFAHQPIPIPLHYCEKVATLPICSADFYVYRLLRLRL